MKRWLHAWDHWWLRTAPPHGIALLRIVFGGYLLFYFGLRAPHIRMLFTRDALIIPFPSNMPAVFSLLLTPPSVETGYAIFILMMVSLLCFTTGYCTRTSATVATLIYAYYMLLAIHLYNTSYNRLFLFILFLFTFSGAGKAFSYEMWKKHGSVLAWEPASILTQRLISLQIFATYLGVSWQKVWLPDWQGGTMLLKSFQGMWATPLAFWFVRLGLPMFVYDWMVFITKSFQVVLPFGLWSKKYRLWFFAGGALFHIVVSLFLSAMWWFFAMIACYITFIEPEEILQKLRAWKGDRIPAQAMV